MISRTMPEQIQLIQAPLLKLLQYGIGIISILLLHLQILNTSTISTRVRNPKPGRKMPIPMTMNIAILTTIMMIKLLTFPRILPSEVKVINPRIHLLGLRRSNSTNGRRITHRIHVIRIIVMQGNGLNQLRRKEII